MGLDPWSGDPAELIARDTLFVKPSWHADAACREHPEVNWFPERGEDARPAKAICAGCLVRAECLEAAFEHRVTTGIWGGTSERERRRLRVQRGEIVVGRWSEAA